LLRLTGVSAKRLQSWPLEVRMAYFIRVMTLQKILDEAVLGIDWLTVDEVSIHERWLNVVSQSAEKSAGMWLDLLADFQETLDRGEVPQRGDIDETVLRDLENHFATIRGRAAAARQRLQERLRGEQRFMPPGGMLASNGRPESLTDSAKKQAGKGPGVRAEHRLLEGFRLSENLVVQPLFEGSEEERHQAVIAAWERFRGKANAEKKNRYDPARAVELLKKGSFTRMNLARYGLPDSFFNIHENRFSGIERDVYVVPVLAEAWMEYPPNLLNPYWIYSHLDDLLGRNWNSLSELLKGDEFESDMSFRDDPVISDWSEWGINYSMAYGNYRRVLDPALIAVIEAIIRREQWPKVRILDLFAGDGAFDYYLDPALKESFPGLPVSYDLFEEEPALIERGRPVFQHLPHFRIHQADLLEPGVLKSRLRDPVHIAIAEGGLTAKVIPSWAEAESLAGEVWDALIDGGYFLLCGVSPVLLNAAIARRKKFEVLNTSAGVIGKNSVNPQFYILHKPVNRRVEMRNKPSTGHRPSPGTRTPDSDVRAEKREAFTAAELSDEYIMNELSSFNASPFFVHALFSLKKYFGSYAAMQAAAIAELGPGQHTDLLDFLVSKGVNMIGVDEREINHPRVKRQKILQFLRTLPDGSLEALYSRRVLECGSTHPIIGQGIRRFEEIFFILAECRRVLKDSSILVIEVLDKSKTLSEDDFVRLGFEVVERQPVIAQFEPKEEEPYFWVLKKAANGQFGHPMQERLEARRRDPQMMPLKAADRFVRETIGDPLHAVDHGRREQTAVIFPMLATQYSTSKQSTNDGVRDTNKKLSQARIINSIRSMKDALVLEDFNEMIDPENPDRFSVEQMVEAVKLAAASGGKLSVTIYNADISKPAYKMLSDLIRQLEQDYPELKHKIKLSKDSFESVAAHEISKRQGPVIHLRKNKPDFAEELKALSLEEKVLDFRYADENGDTIHSAGTLGVAVAAAEALGKRTAELLKQSVPEAGAHYDARSGHFYADREHAGGWSKLYEAMFAVEFSKAA
jgi:hypothetical protein